MVVSRNTKEKMNNNMFRNSRDKFPATARSHSASATLSSSSPTSSLTASVTSIISSASLEQIGISMGLHSESEDETFTPLMRKDKVKQMEKERERIKENEENNMDRIRHDDLEELKIDDSHDLNSKEEVTHEEIHKTDPEVKIDIDHQFDSIETPKKKGFFCLKISWQSLLRIVILSLLVCGIGTFLGFLIGSNSVQTSLVGALEWLSKLPKWGSSLLMIGMYCIGLLLFCPGTPFNLASGFLFGMWIGCGVALGGCVLGAVFAFLLGRTIARDWVKNKVDKKPKFKAVDWAIQKNGLYIVFLTRLSPLFPFPLLNYAFGITKVQVWQYLGGTFAGVLPATLAYTYLGTLMRNLTDIWTATKVDSKKNSNSIVWLAVGSILTLLSIVVISLITKRAIAKATREYALQHGLDENTLSTTPSTTESGSNNGSSTSTDDEQHHDLHDHHDHPIVSLQEFDHPSNHDQVELEVIHDK